MVTLICMVVFSAALSELDPGEPYTATWFPSITRTCWWSMVTLTGVGYGDEYPANLAGRAVRATIQRSSRASHCGCRLANAASRQIASRLQRIASQPQRIARDGSRFALACDVPSLCITPPCRPPVAPNAPMPPTGTTGTGGTRSCFAACTRARAQVAVICAGVGIIIVAVPIEVIGRYFSAHFLRHKYSNAMATECSTNEGRVDISRLHARLRHLDARGLLRVPCPAREEDTGELVARYDGKGGLQLEQDEWAELMKDVVAERGDWEGCAIRKTVADLHELQADFRSVRAQLDGLMKRRLQQQAELIELAGVRAHK